MQKGILILFEPDASVMDALTLLLEGEGWRVIGVNSCTQMESTVDEHRIAAIISEASLPGCSPEQILEQCKARSIPVVFTGHDVPLQGAVDLIRAGALDYLDKPFAQGRLLDLLERLHTGQND
jgi:DNA-binding NtrC family response regulator